MSSNNDVTKIILNFQNFLIALLKAFITVGLERGNDEWDELTENAFDILVLGILKEKYNCTINCVYEAWGKKNITNSLK